MEKMQQSMSTLQVVNSARSIVKIPLLEHEHEHGDENHGMLDPHVWLSPMNLIEMANNMTEALIAVDSQHAKTYNENLQKLSAELKILDKEIQNILAPFAGESFYVFHPSFGYFAERYHLHQKAVEVEGKSPTPKQLLQLIRQAKQEQVKVIFVQEQFDPRSGAAIARAIDGEVVALNPLAEDVVGNLRTMAAKIREGVSHQ
jgi:zinc transport system substrate-binding protein